MNELSDARDLIRDLENKLESSSAMMNSLRVEWENKIRDREEELESQRLLDFVICNPNDF